MEKNKPVRTLWHGNVKANIWENLTQNGVLFSVNYARIYKDKHGKIREAYTFSDVENLRLEALARQASDLCNKFKQEYNAKSKAQSQQVDPQQLALKSPVSRQTNEQTSSSKEHGYATSLYTPAHD